MIGGQKISHSMKNRLLKSEYPVEEVAFEEILWHTDLLK